jgi:hypothetical protein
MEMVDDRLLAELNVKDDLAFKFGDTLDVKASIGMVVITFLATETAYLLDKHVTGISHMLQAGSVIALVIATITSIVELWPRDYLMVEPEANTASRIAELKEHYSQYDDKVDGHVLKELTTNEIKWATDRIAANQSKNNSKAKWLEWSYKATAVAFVLNAITLVVVWLTHPF